MRSKLQFLAALLACGLVLLPALACAKQAHYSITEQLFLPTVPNILMVYIPGILLITVVSVLAMIRPEVGFLFYVALLPFRSIQVFTLGGADVVLPDLVTPPLVLGWLIRGTYLGEQRYSPFRRTGVDAPLLLMTFWIMLSLFWSVGYANTFSKIIQMFYGLVLFYMAVQLIKDARYLIALSVAWVLGAFVNSAASIYNYGLTGKRSGGLNVNSLESAMYGLFGISLTIGFWAGVRGQKRWRTAIMIGLIIQLVGFVIAQCRGPMLGLMAGLVLPMILSSDIRRMVIRGTVAAVLVYGVLLLVSEYYHLHIYNPFHRLLETGAGRDVGQAYRIDIWQSILFHALPAAPLLGVGAGSLGGLLMNWGHIQLYPQQVAHSMYLEVLAALGPVGFALMLWFWIAYTRRLWTYFHQIEDHLCRGVLLGGMCAVVSKCVASTTYGFYIEDRYQWTTLGIVLAFAKVGMELRGLRTPMSDPPVQKWATRPVWLGGAAARPAVLPPVAS